jgi:predicted ATPase
MTGEDMAFLADLLSLPASECRQLSNLSPQRKKERILQVLIRQLEGLARRLPIAVVFEDAHWIDQRRRASCWTFPSSMSAVCRCC